MKTPAGEQRFIAPSAFDAPTEPIEAQELRLWWAMEENYGVEIPSAGGPVCHKEIEP